MLVSHVRLLLIGRGIEILVARTARLVVGLLLATRVLHSACVHDLVVLLARVLSHWIARAAKQRTSVVSTL